MSRYARTRHQVASMHCRERSQEMVMAVVGGGVGDGGDMVAG